MLAPRPTAKLEDHPLSAVRDCLFSLFAATLHIKGRSSIRNLRTHHAVVTGTHKHGAQGASNTKPVEVEGLQLVTSALKRLQLARPKLYGTGRSKLKKTRAGQNDTRDLVPAGYETLSHQTMGSNRPRPDRCTCMGQPPKNPRSPVEHESCREVLVSFTAAVLLDHPGYRPLIRLEECSMKPQ